MLYCGVGPNPLVPISTSTLAELLHTLNLSRPRILFADRSTLGRCCRAAETATFVQQIIALDAPKTSHRLVVPLTTFVANRRVPSAGPAAFRAAPVDMHTTVQLILCSSGTTGLPKGVQLTQFNLHSACSVLAQAKETLIAFGMEGMRSLSVIPWFHAYGLLTMCGLIVNCTPLVTMARYSDAHFLGAIERHQCGMVFGVPPLLLMLAKSPAVANYDLSSLRMIYSGAAPLSVEVAQAVRDRVPSLLGVFQGFGMSEMTLSVLQQSPAANTAGSVGTLRPGIWGKVCDPETGATLAGGERGEMCFRGGSAIMKGYVGDAEATRGTIDADGWLHTGDIGYYDEAGEWYIVDRLKELIKYKGFQVPPAEIEAVLLQHPDVVDAGVIGVPDEAVGERAVGFVVRRKGATLSAAEVVEFVAERMSHAKRLHGGVRFVAAIPKNVTGKILRRELRANVAAKL